MNFRVAYSNSAVQQFLGDEDNYRILKNGVLRLDVKENDRRVRRYLSPSGWLEVTDLEPADWQDDPDI